MSGRLGRWAAGAARPSRFWRRLALVAAAAGIAASGGAMYYQHVQNAQIMAARLDEELRQVADGIQARMHAYLGALQGVRGLLLVVGPDAIDQRALSDYVASIGAARQFPGARGFGFIRLVPREDEQDFVARQRRLRNPDFVRRPLGPNEGDRFIIELIEPLVGNVNALGLDIASEANRRSAALGAMATAGPQLTAPITLVQAGSRKGQAWLLLLPMYKGAALPAPAERPRALLGWTYAPLQIDAILRGLVASDGSLDIGLADVTDGGAVTVLAQRLRDAALPRAATEMEVFGRRWHLTLGADQAFMARQNLTPPLAVLAIGLGATSALSLLVLLTGALRRRRLEARAEEAKLAAIVDSSIDAIIGMRLDGTITSWNRGAESLFGHAAAHAIGRTNGELLVPAERQEEEGSLLARFAQGAAMADFETQRLRSDGQLVDVWVAIAPVRGARGEVAGLAATVRDITERKAAEARIQAANARLEETVASRTMELQQTNTLLGSVLDAATGVAIVATDAGGTITVFNRGAELMLGYSAQEVVGHADPTLFHDAREVAACAAGLPGGAQGGMQAILRCSSEGGQDWTYLRKDGGRITVSLIVSTMRGEDGRVDGYLGVAVDVTGHRALLDSLRQAKEQADAASEAKSTFLANMSHEIRTPMNAVLGMLQLVQMTELDARQQEYVGKAEQAGRALLQLLNDVLDFSKIEAGKLRLDPHPFEVDALMRDLGVVLAGNQGGKPLEVMFDMDPALPRELVGDRLRLQQVLINLAGNAIKFTERGSVKVSLDVLARSGDEVRVRVAVRDTGIGIAPEQRTRIFDGFTQADASISRRFGGTGLGLVICRRLVELMGGTLEVDSAPGAGSVFSFDLTLGAGPDAAPRRGARLRVLVVDDHPEVAAALLRMVRGLGWDGVLAGSGAQALERVREPGRFDVVLLDWRMPGVDGLQTAGAIRSGERDAPVIIMVTAFGREDLRQAADDAAAPYADVLTKPVTPAVIEQAVTRALAGTPAAAPPRVRPRRLAGLDVLVVEDNALNRQVASELLAREGATVALAEDGSLAVRYLREAARLPDVVLMDMQMPVMDGLEATRRIRAELGPGLRIVAMTANASDADRRRCLEAGMDDHMGKPIDLEALVRLLRPQAAESAAAAGAQPDGDEAIGQVLARFGDDAALYLRSVDGFAAQAGDLLARAGEALARGEAGDGADLLHSLRGMAATIGARAVARRLGEWEIGLRNGAGQAPPAAALADLEREIAHACARLRGAAGPQAQAVAAAAPDGAAPDLGQLAVLLESGNMRALEIGERLAARAAPGSLEAQLAAEIGNLDFAVARATLARLS